jgi:SAM-dependent methyltransferase
VADDIRSLWDANAEAWVEMSRAGYDVYRDLVNTPAFMTMLPEVSGLVGLDLGCGEGHNTRLVSRQGARVVGVDIAPTFLRAALSEEQADPLGIGYLLADGACLPLRDQAVDFVVAFMSLMDMADAAGALAETYRVLRPGGFLQFSILHPLSLVPYRRWISEDGQRVALAIGGYFDGGSLEETWTFNAAPEEVRRRHQPFRARYSRRTISGWLNEVARAGFWLEHLCEPWADAQTAAAHPEVADTRIAPYFLLIRARRPHEPD